MGCYDTVYVPCPKCGLKSEFQSKGGACLLREFELGDAPDDVMSDVNRHAPYTCTDCGTKFEVRRSERDGDGHCFTCTCFNIYKAVEVT